MMAVSQTTHTQLGAHNGLLMILFVCIHDGICGSNTNLAHEAVGERNKRARLRESRRMQTAKPTKKCLAKSPERNQTEGKFGY